MKYQLLLILTCLYLPGFGQPDTDFLKIPLTSETVSLDGVLEPAEWDKAEVVTITNQDQQEVPVHVMYDAAYLYIAFKNVVNKQGIKLNTEVLINTDTKSDTWTQDTFWFHVSYSCCFARGMHYFWENCSDTHPEWNANTYPFKAGAENIELRIAWSLLDIDDLENLDIAIAFKLSNPLEQHSYWPLKANIALPKSWARVTF